VTKAALGPLARQLSRPAHGLGLLARPLFGGLLVVDVALHLAEGALALHLLLERLQGLVDVVVADEDLYHRSSKIASVAVSKSGTAGSGPPKEARLISEAPAFVHAGLRV
jgi:uncharacterized membrane protein